MNEVTTLEGSEKKKWTTVFVLFVVLFSVACLEFMNLRYDSLARYPYKDETSKDLIRNYLSQDEIEYIIEYSIPPNMFIAYIREPGFSIYHAAEYKRLSESQWNKSPAEIVRMVEETRTLMSVEELELYFMEGNYAYEDVSRWVKNEAPEGIQLVTYAFNLDTYLDHDHSVSSRVPYLVNLPEEIPSSSSEIRISEELIQPLQALCGGITTGLSSSRACAALQVTKGYVSYDDTAQTDNDYAPGHDEHQLGLAVDFGVEGIDDSDFSKTAQAQWLLNNAWKYGFVLTWNEEDVSLTGHRAETMHYRYVGVDLAKTIHDSGLSFARYKAQIRESSMPTPLQE